MSEAENTTCRYCKSRNVEPTTESLNGETKCWDCGAKRSITRKWFLFEPHAWIVALFGLPIWFGMATHTPPGNCMPVFYAVLAAGVLRIAVPKFAPQRKFRWQRRFW